MNVTDRTSDPEVIKAWSCLDAELQTMESILPRLPMAVREDYKKCIQYHKDYIESGLTPISWEYQEILQALDPYLRLRWDMQCRCYIIERVDTGLRAWIRLFRWANDDGSPKNLSLSACREIVAKLQASDMRRWATPHEYLQHKRRKAQEIQRSNAAKVEDELYGVIDDMTNRQIKEFIDVERAIATGERVDVVGQDAATMNMWHELAKAGYGPMDGLDLPDDCEAINPHQSPTAPTGGRAA